MGKSASRNPGSPIVWRERLDMHGMFGMERSSAAAGAPSCRPSRPVDLQRLQRAVGEGRIRVDALRGTSRLHRLYQDGCAKIRLPRDAESRGLEAVLLNTAGGLTGGDRLTWRADVAAGAELTLTTQACERIYRSTGAAAEVWTHLSAGPNATLSWLPQETLLFDQGSLERRLDVELAAGARFLAVEAVVLGRTAMGEQVRFGRLRDRWRVRRAGRLAFADDLRLEGEIARVVAAPPLLAGGCAFASLLLVADDAQSRLSAVRDALGPSGGASAFDGKLVARIAAADGRALRRVLAPALEALHGAALPRIWRA
jgi:urease accessory protein